MIPIKKINVIEWRDDFAADFVSLSVEWLERYVSVEPADLRILNYPHEEILDRGGMIFFAVDNEKPVGTVAMVPISDGVFELAKLAVTENYKGNHIGSALMKKALAFADEQGAAEVILFTNKKLIPAIHLYRKFGFHDVELTNNKYLESDMKMSKYLGKEKWFES